jgi:hypothetical protein
MGKNPKFEKLHRIIRRNPKGLARKRALFGMEGSISVAGRNPILQLPDFGFRISGFGF